ncbi:unnamed protein product [Aphanomyces euteiches]
MGDVNVGSFFFYHLHVMHTLTAAVFNSQAEKCRVAAKLPTDLTVQDMLNACAFPACVTWYNQLATLPCTVGGKPSSTMGQICGGKSAPASSSGKYCTASDYSSATNQLALSCALDSGISTTDIASNQARFCATPSCVKFTQAYAALTCLDATGKPASDFAKFCAATTTAAPTTTKKPTTTAAPTTTATADPTVGFLTTLTPQSTATRECTAKDMPYYYPEEYNACLRAAGITSIPSALSDITKLCQYDVCVEVFEMYRHVFCAVNGSRTMGYVCVGYTKSDPFLVPQNNSITLVQSTSSLPSLSISACLTSAIVILLAF